MKNYFILTFILVIFIISNIFLISCSNKDSTILAQTNNESNVNSTNKNNYLNNSNISNTNKNKNSNTKITTDIKPPKIISRKEWNAKKGKGKGKPHSIKYITIHHSASKQRPNSSIKRKLRNLQNFSQSNAKLADGRRKKSWYDIPYHFYISATGEIAQAREIKYAGDTNTNYDPTGHALVVLEGNFEKEVPTKKQKESLKKMIKWLQKKYKVQESDIKAHNDYTETACPGKNLKSILPTLINSKKKNKYVDKNNL